MSILLDDKKIRDVLTYDCTTESYLALDYIEAGTKAQAKKIYEWGNEECREHGFIITEEALEYPPKHQCPECWQGLLKEIE